MSWRSTAHGTTATDRTLGWGAHDFGGPLQRGSERLVTDSQPPIHALEGSEKYLIIIPPF